MLLTIQFPIADARPFLKEGNPRLSLELSKNKKLFVRCFGKVKLRENKDFLTQLPLDWVKDVYYVSAKAALTVPDLGQYYQWHQKSKPSFLLKPSYLSRRLFFDNNALARVEVGLRVESPVVLDKKQCKSVIRDYLTLPTTVPSFTAEDGCANNYLVNQGESLAKLFLHATTPQVKATEFKANSSVMACNPVLFFEYSEDAQPLCGSDSWLYKSILPDDAKKIDKSITNDVTLAYYEYKICGTSYAVWFIGCNNKNKEKVRLLKLCLLRLHSEQEVLKNIIIFINYIIEKGNKDNINIDVLNKYLSSSTKAIFKKKYYGILQSSILDIVNQCELRVNKAELIDIEHKRLELKNQLSAIVRRQTMKKAEFFLNAIITKIGEIMTNSTTVNFGNGNNFTGSFTVGSTITNSFNTAEKATIPDLKEKLEVLVTNVSKLCEHIPNQDKQEQISRALDRFTNESVTINPDKSFLELSGKGLIDAAKAVADFAKPIAEAVGAVLLLFP